MIGFDYQPVGLLQSGHSTNLVNRRPRRAARWRKSNENVRSLNNLIRAQQHHLRDRQPERLRGLEVDDQLELLRLLDRQVAGFRTFEDAIDVTGGATRHLHEVRSVRHQPTRLGLRAQQVERGEPRARYELRKPRRRVVEHRITSDQQGLSSFADRGVYRRLDLVWRARLDDVHLHAQLPRRFRNLLRENDSMYLVGWIDQRRDASRLRHDLMQQLQRLRHEAA